MQEASSSLSTSLLQLAATLTTTTVVMAEQPKSSSRVESKLNPYQFNYQTSSYHHTKLNHPFQSVETEIIIKNKFFLTSYLNNILDVSSYS